MRLEFQDFHLDRQQDYLDLLWTAPQLASDYSFINLWSWQQHYGLTWAWDSDLVWLRQAKNGVYWAPVGNWSEIDWCDKLSGFSSPVRFIRVPEMLAFQWKVQLPGRVTLKESRNHWDYVYSVEDLAYLQKPRFEKKRVLLEQFQSRYGYEYVDLDECNIEEALDLQEDWCLWRDCESSETLLQENDAILRAFDDWSSLANICGGGLKVDGKMIAYTVAEPLSNECLIIHFEKACPKHVGSYQAINNLFLRNQGKGFRWVNREQDLGEEGLRKSKLSYNPVSFVKKYEVILEGDRQAHEKK